MNRKELTKTDYGDLNHLVVVFYYKFIQRFNGQLLKHIVT